MVQLLIDGQQATIKKGTNFQLNFENSYFAKGNTWSFEIELPLDDKHNATIFGAINRHDVRQYAQTHTAELIIPGMNHITGSVVVTKVTETSVSIQLASTRETIDSTIANRYIHELDITKKNIENKLPSVRCARFPVCDTEGTYEVGMYIVQTVEKVKSNPPLEFKFTKFYFVPTAGNAPKQPIHPYLYDVVILLLEAAGYTVGTNALDTPMMRALVIVRATIRQVLCYHLPHWTFSEFITEVERFAGVHFIFNNTTKVVNIVSVSATLTGSTSGSTTDFSTAAYNTDYVVVDEFSAEIDTNTAIDSQQDTNGNNNVGYDLLGDFSDKYEKLSDEILSAANITPITYDEYAKMTLGELKNLNQKQLLLIDGQYYMPQPEWWPFKCNRLHDIKTSDEADVELLRITPCAFTDWQFDVYECTKFYETGEMKYYPTEAAYTTRKVRVPVAEGPEKQYTTDGYLLDVLLDNETENEGDETPEESTVMRVAFVDDIEQPIYIKCKLHDILSGTGTGYWGAKIPYTLPGLMQYDTENYIDADLVGDSAIITPALTAINARPYTLELTARSAAGSGTAQGIKRLLPNTTIEYTKRIIAHTLPDVNKLFLIHGKRFICKSLTVEINEDGIVPLMEGTFYMFD